MLNEAVLVAEAVLGEGRADVRAVTGGEGAQEGVGEVSEGVHVLVFIWWGKGPRGRRGGGLEKEKEGDDKG